MWPEVGVKTLPPSRVAYLMRKGMYEGISDVFKELVAWIKANKLRPVGEPVLIYHSNPAGMPPPLREWELQISVEGEMVAAADENGPGVKDLPQREVVFAMYRGGYSSIEFLLPALFQVVYDKGYRLAAPAEEVYPRDFYETPVDKLETEVRFPVEPR
ncbi:MAG: GyrI-like domain-containing protein [Bacillota bacterium]